MGVWGLTDLSGGIAIQIRLNWGDPRRQELFAFLYDNQKNLVVTSAIENGSDENSRRDGLFGGHAYSLLKVELVKTNEGKMVQLLNIRNPHGQGEFNGDWSDNSDNWDIIDRKLK